MHFFRRHPVSLRELLLSPLIIRFGAPELAAAPHPTPALLHDLATRWGHGANAARTALSRLRAEGHVESVRRNGQTELRLGPVGRSVTTTVRRPTEAGLSLAVFSFSTADARPRHLVREALRLHGFHKLAQNTYVSSHADTRALEALLARRRLADHVFLFRCTAVGDDARLKQALGVHQLGRKLTAFADALDAFLAGATGDELARRYLAAAPAHYRVTFLEVPPLPTEWQVSAPLARLQRFGRLGAARRRALEHYLRSFASAAFAAQTPHMP